MPQRTYSGPLARGRVKFPDRTLSFERGVPVDVTDHEAGLLDDEWSAPKPPKTKPKADPADTKEP